MVNWSFFPEQLSLISAVWYTSVDSRIVARGDFISLVSEEYHHPYAAELCGALSIWKGIDHILSRYPHLSMAFAIKIGSNYQSVIYSLWNTSLVITLNTYLHQIVREISIIRVNG